MRKTLNYMFSFEKKDIDQQQLPEKTGVFLFRDNSKILYIGRSANLRRSIQRLLEPGEDDKEVFKLASLTTEISYLVTDDLFSALIEEKILMNEHSPDFNNTFKLHEQYVYLAIDFYKVPFLNITENTSEEFHYLGPFQKRFFVYDFIDTMAECFQYPSCENEKYPCYKLKDNSCLGWCLKDKTEIGKILLKSYMKPDEEITSKLMEEIENLENELEFAKAEKQKEKLQIIQKYNNYITFFHLTKNLNTELFQNERTIKIENGMIAEIARNGKYHNFSVFNPEYRDNELLAHDKSQLAERWIVYNYCKKNKPNIISTVQDNAVKEFNRIFDPEI